MLESPRERGSAPHIFVKEYSKRKPDPGKGGSRGSWPPNRRYKLERITGPGPFVCYRSSTMVGGVERGSFARFLRGPEGRTLLPLSPREEETSIMRIALVVAFVQVLAAPFLIVLFLSLIFLGLLFLAVVGRAMRNPGQTGDRGEDEEGGGREREDEERGRDDGP